MQEVEVEWLGVLVVGCAEASAVDYIEPYCRAQQGWTWSSRKRSPRDTPRIGT